LALALFRQVSLGLLFVLKGNADQYNTSFLFIKPSPNCQRICICVICDYWCRTSSVIFHNDSRISANLHCKITREPWAKAKAPQIEADDFKSKCMTLIQLFLLLAVLFVSKKFKIVTKQVGKNYILTFQE